MKRLLIVCIVAGLLVAGAVASTNSGLAVGEKIEAFLVKNCEGGDPYCQVCKFGKRPKLITVGDLDDPAWIEDLKAIQKLHEKYSGEGKGLAVFALAAAIKDGKAAPVTDPQAALVRLKEIREKNGITFPLVIAQNADEVYKAQNKSNPGYKIFENYYNVTTSRTVMFGDGSNKVQFNAVLSDASEAKQLAELEAVLQKNL
jgi:hypothetical protein